MLSACATRQIKCLRARCYLKAKHTRQYPVSKNRECAPFKYMYAELLFAQSHFTLAERASAKIISPASHKRRNEFSQHPLALNRIESSMYILSCILLFSCRGRNSNQLSKRLYARHINFILTCRAPANIFQEGKRTREDRSHASFETKHQQTTKPFALRAKGRTIILAHQVSLAIPPLFRIDKSELLLREENEMENFSLQIYFSSDL